MIDTADLTERIAAVLRHHRWTTCMDVAMGWTCRCGHWASGRDGDTPSDHQADRVVEVVLAAATPGPARMGSDPVKFPEETLGGRAETSEVSSAQAAGSAADHRGETSNHDTDIRGLEGQA